MEWELSKENFAPVKQGRSKAVLSEAHDTSDSNTKKAIEQKRRELWKEVREYTGDDPLEAWLRLVKWTQEHVIGGNKAELQKTIEICTKELLKLNRYSSDVRFLRLWIQYADCLPDPSDVFCFLREKQIGHEYALFYEAHATYNELRGNCTAADTVYNEGINRCAKPVDRLKQKYEAFQKRMAQRIQRKIQEEGLLAVTGGEASSSSRVSLSNLSRAPSAVAGRHSQQAAPSLLGVSNPRAGPQSQFALAGGLPSILPVQKPLQAVPVAVDEEFQGRRQPSLASLPGFSALPQATSNLKELKPYGIIRKENNEKPSMWTSAAMPQNSLLIPPFGSSSSGKLEICVDDEFMDEPVPQAQQQNALRTMLDKPLLPFSMGHAAQPPGSVFLGQPQIPILSQQPQAWPLALAASHAPCMQASQPLSLAEDKKKSSSSGYDDELLAGADGKEQSFEEARALRYMLAPAICNRGAAMSQISAGQHIAAPNSSLALSTGFKPLHSLPARCASGLGQPKQPVSNMSQDGLPTMASLAANVTGGSTPKVSCDASHMAGPSTGPSAVMPSALADISACTFTAKPTSFAVPADVKSAGPAAPLGPMSGLLQKATSTAPGSTNMISAPANRTAHQTGRTALQQVPMLATQQASAPPLTSACPAAADLQTVAGSTDSKQAGLAKVEHKVAGVNGGNVFGMALPDPLAHVPHQEEVTISTRAAFDMLNDMFSDAVQPSEQKVASIVHQTSTNPLASDSSHVTASGVNRKAQHETAVAVQPQLGGYAGAGMDHTSAKRSHQDSILSEVTISTRAAFDAVNDMFCDPLPHEEQLKQRKVLTAVPAASKPIRASDVCRLANMNKSGMSRQASAQPVMPMGSARAGTAPSSFMIHEDTDFVVPGMLAASSTAVAGPSAMYEDTDMLAGTADQGMMIYEDTQFLPGICSQAAAPAMGQLGGDKPRGLADNAAGSSACGFLPLSRGGNGGAAGVAVQMHEDTEFMTRDIMEHGRQLGAAMPK